MRTKVKAASPEAALDRLLTALEQELVEASEQEVLQAARDLGMKPESPGSAAFIGLTTPCIWQLSDFFELEESQRLMAAAVPPGRATPALPQGSRTKPARHKARRAARRERPRTDKDAGDK
jgi:hypothetical protein